MGSRFVRAASALLVVASVAGCELPGVATETEPTGADRRACNRVQTAPEPPQPPTGHPLWDAEEVWGDAELRYQNQLARYEQQVQTILGLVSNADDARLREQTTLEGARVRCRDLGI